jgi:BlaI family penicillinase repressor
MKKSPKHSKNHELAEAEWNIMKVVWKKEPCAAGTVQDALQETKGWAYSTVKTTMDRMVKKGLLKIKRIRNLQLFSSCISEKEAKQGEIMRTIRRAFDGALTPMMQFMLQNEKLSTKELKELRKAIDDAK